MSDTAEQGALFEIPDAYVVPAWVYVPNGQDACQELDELEVRR